MASGISLRAVPADGADDEASASTKVATSMKSRAPAEKAAKYPPEAYADYPYDKNPPQSWFDRRKIDQFKVHSLFFDMFKKPKSFFPYDLRPGDTVRIYFTDCVDKGDPLKLMGTTKENFRESTTWAETRKVFFDGVIMDFFGPWQARKVIVRAMVGKEENAIGYEMTFPMHSPLVTGIKVLRRGYIGRNKNAYFIRGMIGKENQVPLDKERTEIDKQHMLLRRDGRQDEIPGSEYPQMEHDRYPIPVWKQDEDDWDEEKYRPEDFDMRSDFEKEIIGEYQHKQRDGGKRTRRLTTRIKNVKKPSPGR